MLVFHIFRTGFGCQAAITCGIDKYICRERSLVATTQRAHRRNTISIHLHVHQFRVEHYIHARLAAHFKSNDTKPVGIDDCQAIMYRASDMADGAIFLRHAVNKFLRNATQYMIACTIHKAQKRQGRDGQAPQGRTSLDKKGFFTLSCSSNGGGQTTGTTAYDDNLIVCHNETSHNK